MSEESNVIVKVIDQGDAVCGEHGYMLKRGVDIAAFYLDGWGKTCRIYALTSSGSTVIDGAVENYPTLTLENGSEYDSLTEICFPEFEGWSVHSVIGGKTMAICLTREN